MPNFPSSIRFASFLTFDSRGMGDAEKRSRDYTYAIKNNGLINCQRFIPMVAKRIASELTELHCFKDFLGPDVLAIPMPRSSLRVKGALWPSQLICESLKAERLVAEVSECLIRHTATRKSSVSPRNRGTAHEHYETLKMDEDALFFLANYKRVLIVDDVVTRGATFMGAFPHVASSFRSSEVKCFAFVSTRGMGNFRQPIDPVEGTITYQFDSTDRQP